MTKTLIHNATIITPNATLDNAWLLIEGQTIHSFGVDTPPDNDLQINANGNYLIAGMIDLHVHGAVGHDVMDAKPQALHEMAQFFASHGVTSFLPTTLTASHQELLSALTAIKSAQQSDYTGARIIGAHLEGPYLNPAKCGAQNVDQIRRATSDETDELLALNIIKLLSLAPEYPENHDLIADCIQRGITVSAAHTNATLDEMQTGIEHGIRHATHTFNAMPSLHHRNPGGMSALLLDERINCELIADTIHVHPVMMNLLYQLKGNQHLILISDAMRAAGMPDGDYSLGELTVTVADGKATLADGTLAGSILTMDVALRNFMSATGKSLEHIWRVSSYNAAKAINLRNKGSITVGYDADLVIVDTNINVHTTIIEGTIAYQAQTT